MLVGKIQILQKGDRLIQSSFAGDSINLLIEREGDFIWYQVSPDENGIIRIQSKWLITEGNDVLEMSSRQKSVNQEESSDDDTDEEPRIKTF